jgi:hypothetical protein
MISCLVSLSTAVLIYLLAEYGRALSSRTGRRMGHGCYPIHSSGRKYVCPLFGPVNKYLTHCQSQLDTPWDEPTKRSLEFRRYLTGEFVNDVPWNRIGQTASCEFTCRTVLTICVLSSEGSTFMWDVDSQSSRTNVYYGCFPTSLVFKVCIKSPVSRALTNVMWKKTDLVNLQTTLR